MTHARWIIPSCIIVLSGCASDPALQSVVAEPVAQTERSEPHKDDIAPPTTADAGEDALVEKATLADEAAVSNTPQVVAAAPQYVSLPPSVFEDASVVQESSSASTVSPRTPPTGAASAVLAARPITAPVPSYTVASLTDPAAVEVTIAPQRTPPKVAVPARPNGPSAMKFLTTLEANGDAPDGQYGYVLLDADTGATLSERNADIPLPPASIAKLLAANAILETMGPSGRFRTALLADGTVAGGVLQGDLHLVGSGDPSLDRGDISTLAERLSAAGVRQVAGRFVYHGDALPEVSLIDQGQPAGAVYNTGLSGLNLDHNERRGASPVKNPARYTAEAMRAAARSKGVDLPVPVKGSGAARGSEVAVHESAPVSAILTEMFDISRNMTAEALGAAAAAALSGKPRSLREAAQINAQWAQAQIGPIGGSGWQGFDFANNSGLSMRSRATPRQMAALVRYGYRQHGDQFKRLYEQQSSGSAAGVNYAIRAKIGTMSYVRGLGGIVTLGGREMVFAIMAANPSRSAGNAKAWMGKARRLEQALMSDWLKDNWPSQVASR